MVFYRKLVDRAGNIYCVEIPQDVDPESPEDILIASQDGIIKLLAYKLETDAVYRAPINNEEVSAKKYTFYKKLFVAELLPNLSQQEFGALMEAMIAKAREQRINKVRLTQFEGRPVEQDTKGYFVRKSIECEGCSKELKGIQRLSMNGEGTDFTRLQMFEPEDTKAVRLRPGARKMLCSSCAPHSVPIPDPAVPQKADVELIETNEDKLITETPTEAPRIVPEVIKTKVNTKGSIDNEKALKRILERQDMNPEMFKGYALGVLETLLNP